MFHHFKLLLYLDIPHVLKAKGKYVQRSLKKILQVMTRQKKNSKYLFYDFKI